jgi:hypothetical protein
LCSEFPNVDEDRLEEVIKQLVIDGYAKSSLDGYARITKDGKDAVVIMKRRPYKEATKTLEEVRKSIHKKDSSKRHL